MKDKIIGSIVVVLLLVVAVLIHMAPRYDGVPTSRVLQTSAALSSIKGYERVYVDEESDYAIFYKREYRANQLQPGYACKVNNQSGKVTETSDTSFCIKLGDTTNIIPGAVVFASGNRAVGFVSEVSGEIVLCHYF